MYEVVTWVNIISLMLIIYKDYELISNGFYRNCDSALVEK